MYTIPIYYSYSSIYYRIINIILTAAKEKFGLIQQEYASMQFTKESIMHIINNSSKIKVKTEIKDIFTRILEGESLRSKVK